MKNENANALKDALDAYAKNPTYGHELNLTLMISIATSLACIADVLMEKEVSEDGKNEPRKDSDSDS